MLPSINEFSLHAWSYAWPPPRCGPQQNVTKPTPQLPKAQTPQDDGDLAIFTSVGPAGRLPHYRRR